MTTFGIEIEIVNDGMYTQSQIADAIRANGVGCHAEQYGHSVPLEWKVVTDATPGMGINGQRCGFEIVSPILDPRNGDDCWRQIAAVCHALNTLGIKINKSCGLHVHLHVANMNAKNAAAFAAIYIRNEHFIDQAMPKSRRRNNNSFCQTSIGNGYVFPSIADSQEYMDAVNSTLRQLRAVRTFGELSSILNPGGDRYRKLNMQAFHRYGTIEIRQAAGTTNSEKICMWVRFLLTMLEKANESSYFRMMTEVELTPARAWGSMFRWNDQTAVKWLLRRMRKFMDAEAVQSTPLRRELSAVR